jgi:hypothetical protein
MSKEQMKQGCEVNKIRLEYHLYLMVGSVDSANSWEIYS